MVAQIKSADKQGKKPTQPLQKKAQAVAKNSITEEYQNVFSCLDINNDGLVCKEDIFGKINEVGISLRDPRIERLVKNFTQFPEGKVDFSGFQNLVQENSSLLKNIIQKRLAVPDFSSFKKDIAEIYEKTKANTSGQPASYIPQLARVNPDQFAVSVTTVSGQHLSLGDAKVPFCLQSVNKPINYCLALEERGTEFVHQHIGREPSGLGFNELTLNNKGLPHNPMINSGAIMCCSLIKPQLNLADRFDYILKNWKRLSGNSRLNFNNPVYLSERETADRNFALGYFMREMKAFPPNTDLVQTLEFYFQCCSIEINNNGLSTVAATLANGGFCPTTGDKVFSPKNVQHCLSLMGSCGMYDFSGEFAFTIGLPAKSGVSGAVMIVVPKVLGVAIWSPRLDSLGNSVRGIEFCQRLVQKYNFHVYDNILHDTANKKDPRMQKNTAKAEGLVQLCWAASQGDLSEVQHLIAEGVDPNSADYDGRTALHLAACEGHLSIIKYLISKGAKTDAADRWDSTPLVDAKKHKQKKAAQLLEQLLQN